LRKALGQHHLRSGGTCRPALEWLGLARGARVVEIGPGGGVLTRELLAAGARVVAIEIDLHWAFELRRRAATFPFREGLALVAGDALELDWRGLGAAARVAGNLPYQVGTVIVERLIAAAPAGARAAFLLQREVVDRLVARPGDEGYGALSLLVAARARAVRLGAVPPGAFQPPPRVASAFVGIETVEPRVPRAELAGFERVVRSAFAQRRKTLRNALAAAWGRERAAQALAACVIDGGRRAEELDFAAFAALGRALATA
jgi:16S rRNA (adenine1518-N6/adenine1519-N6)-dimethyltransferase